MPDRFAAQHVEAWRSDGAVLIPEFFTPDEVTAVCADFEVVFGETPRAKAPMVLRAEGQLGNFDRAQFQSFETVPLNCSPALNLIGVHPALIAFARQALQAENITLPVPGLGQIHRRSRLRPALPLRFRKPRPGRAVRGHAAEFGDLHVVFHGRLRGPWTHALRDAARQRADCRA